jgi:hypothetical protein
MSHPDPLSTLDPELIRERLSRAVREADVLRRLLRVAESAEARQLRSAGEAKGARQGVSAGVTP